MSRETQLDIHEIDKLLDDDDFIDDLTSLKSQTISSLMKVVVFGRSWKMMVLRVSPLRKFLQRPL